MAYAFEQLLDVTIEHLEALKSEGRVTVDLSKAPELNKQAGALRLEGKGLPKRVLLVRAEDGRLHALHNRCSHLGHRRLDPVPGTATLQCCSVNKSTYDLTGKNIYGPAPRPIETYPLEVDGETVTIRIAG